MSEKKIGRVKEIAPLMVFLFLYLILLKKYDAISFFYIERKAMIFEGFLTVFIFLALFVTQKRGKLRYINSALPVIFVYILFDIYFKSFGSVFKFIAVKQLAELVRVADIYIIILFLFVLFIPILLFIFVDYKKWRSVALGTSMALLVIYCVEWNPNLYLNVFHKAGSEINEWSDRRSVNLNGRLAMLFYWEAKRVKVTEDLKKVSTSNGDSNNLKMLVEDIKKGKSKRNVHLILLESFFDPSLLSKVKFSRNPMHPDFLRHVGSKPTVSISPVFGGRSAQAEFEILCGIPAFADFSEIEFSLFKEKINYSLPALLSKAGYATVVTNSFRPDFFNSDVAYKGLGFQDIYFPKEYSSAINTYFSRGDVGVEKYMFDGDLLKKNMDYIIEKEKSSVGIPVFNYVVSFYGHFPYYIDYNKRPKMVDVIVPQEFDKEPIERIANQFYYRTKALGSMLDKLKKEDPDAIVVIVGDHLPTLEPVDKIKYGYKAYELLGYLGGVENSYQYSFLYITCSGKKVSLDHVSHYNIPEMILDCITDGRYCSKNKCFQPRGNYHERYMKIMARTLGHG